MRSSVKFTIAVFSTLLASGALASPRDPLIIPGIGPDASPAASYRPRYSAPAAAYASPRRQVRYWVAEQRPRPARVAFAPTASAGRAVWEAPRLYDDEYRPAAYNAADPFPPPARPWLRDAPVLHSPFGW